MKIIIVMVEKGKEASHPAKEISQEILLKGSLGGDIN